MALLLLPLNTTQAATAIGSNRAASGLQLMRMRPHRGRGGPLEAFLPSVPKEMPLRGFGMRRDESVRAIHAGKSRELRHPSTASPSLGPINRMRPSAATARWPPMRRHTALLSAVATQAETAGDSSEAAGKLSLEGRLKLTEDDLLPTADVPLPRVDLTTEPEVFIGSDYVDKAYSLLLPEYGRMDSSSERVMPMSFVGFQGGGKTRMLKELSKKLRQESIPAIFIPFGDETEYNIDTEGASTPLFDSLNLRLAWAAATDEARARVARAANVDVDKLNFTMWLRHASISERTAREWLDRQPCVLLIDDLHRFATLEGGERSEAEGEVGEYLKYDFLNNSDRHFVFTEPNNATTVSRKFLRFLDPMFQKWRHLLRPELPLIEEKDLKHFLNNNVTRGTICWAGRSPGLVWEMRQHGGSLEAKVGEIAKLTHYGPRDADEVPPQPEPDAFEGIYDFFVFVVDNDGKLTDVWGYKCVREDVLPPGEDEPFIDYKDRRQQWMETNVWPPLAGDPLPGAADLFSDPDMRSIEINA
ncbi:unnamed protein product [Vitrella brassicaformis CCMP3155]|uniref:AAA+ ATPase domain-containing protein n=1 Tax=Vitrella brassicaformis (strain CCMP3155) TaxID=1169540 RepID=A0A0G4EXP2_VITBC|nr:unnamed protein product [Vitrella brassicaformis CCMP3155]|eukprot:CEM03593.1 unnamed protein product [Vitrella brassicaformis CCMP3155]